jgi:hypothetical protein
MNLLELREAVRQALRDEDAAAQVWSDAVLDRHVREALGRLQARWPAVASIPFVVPAGGPAAWSPAYPAGYLWTEAVEHPVDARPRRFVPFREEGVQATPSLRPQGCAPIPGGTTVRLWFARGYALDGAAGEHPVQLDPAIVLGATLFACRDQAIALAPRLVSPETVRAYREMADRLQREWDAELRRAAAAAGAPMWRVEWC